MAILGLSLILGAVVWFAIRRPPFIETLLSLWRRDPQIDQAPQTRPPRAGTPEADRPQPPVEITTTDADDVPWAPAPAPTQAERDRAAMPPPARLTKPAPGPTPTTTTTTTGAEAETSPQTTPKATAAQPNGAIPSFTLSNDNDMAPPASAAAVARAQPNGAPTSSLSSASPPSILMPPPPRLPTLTNLNNPSLLSAAPSRGNLTLPNRQPARQPGTSTLAPPPSHSSRPAKPSRAVVLAPGRSPLDWARLANGPTSDLRNLPPGTSYLKVTPSMLKRQTGRRGKDAWTSLGGRVYNLTPYLPFHPGGEPELLRCAGRDGTKLFGEIHPWVNYEGMLASSLIGMLVEEHEAGGDGEGDMDAMD